jgi:hypothetical protein
MRMRCVIRRDSSRTSETKLKPGSYADNRSPYALDEKGTGQKRPRHFLTWSHAQYSALAIHNNQLSSLALFL